MDYFLKSVKETLEAINGLLKENHQYVSVKRVRDYYGISASEHSKINFIWRSLDFLAKHGIITLNNGKKPKKYKINSSSTINIAHLIIQIEKNQLRCFKIKDDDKMDTKSNKIPKELMEEILFHIETIEDLLPQLEIIAFITNENGVNNAIRNALSSLSHTIEAIEKINPGFSDKLLEMCSIDFIKMGKIIENGYWNLNVKPGWNAALATKILKQLVLKYGIEE